MKSVALHAGECATCRFNLGRHVCAEDLRAGDVVTCPECGERHRVVEEIGDAGTEIIFEPERPGGGWS